MLVDWVLVAMRSKTRRRSGVLDGWSLGRALSLMSERLYWLVIDSMSFI